MSTTEDRMREMGAFAKRLEDALVTNQAILPILVHAAREGISILFEPWPENDADMFAIRTYKVEGDEEIGASFVVNPETLGSAVVDPDGSVTAVIFPEAKDAD